jgi:cytochrome c oxidase subunit IV
LGIVRPDFLIDNRFLALKLLNWIFIILTIVKAYYITWDFMHMRDETTGLRRAVIWTSIFLISYLIVLILIEGDYIFEVFKSGFIKFDF